MSNLLTRDEYAAMARSLPRPTEAFIDGAFRGADSGATLESHNPATGESIARIAACNADDVDLAVRRGREVFDRGDWSCRHPRERKEIMLELCRLLRRDLQEIALLESLDAGKPIGDCVAIDLPETINCLQWHAELIDKLYDQVAPAGDDAMAMILHEPAGVVAAVLPWNFPLMVLAWKLGPALAAGNSVILKPAEQTSMSALRLAELAHEAGVPRGALQVVTGEGPVVGRALGLHPHVDVVSFTGSSEVGRAFLRYSADSNLKRVVIEGGGKNPCVVVGDAGDLDRIADQVVNGAFWNAGQNCSATSRLIVYEAVREPLLERIVARAGELRTGDPLDPANHLGAMIDRAQYDKVCDYLDRGRREGASEVLAGGPVPDASGLYIEPTILCVAERNAAVAREEIFGPVLTVIPVSGMAQAIEAANDTDYGLAASLFTSNVTRALRGGRAIRAGTVTVNCYGEGDITTPFGGYRHSGFGGRDNSLHAHDQYTELKTLWVDLGDAGVEQFTD